MVFHRAKFNKTQYMVFRRAKFKSTNKDKCMFGILKLNVLQVLYL